MFILSHIDSISTLNIEIMNYTVEKHTQILIALLKAHKIKKVIASPGTTNISLIGSLQSDPFFEIYSSVDERSAAYIACGMAAASGEPVVLSCTGATASRNYLPGLTEAFYRKLPVLAITSSQHFGRVGQYYSQVIDRSSLLADIALESVQVDCVYTEEDEWACGLNINKALLALRKAGGGPAHINLRTTYSQDFSVQTLPAVKYITYISDFKNMPSLDDFKHIAILVGVHNKWSEELKSAVEDFCGAYNAVVIRNHASNYTGEYGYNPDLIINMKQYIPLTEKADLVIYIGSISRYNSGMNEKAMWRVNPDGIIRDSEKKLTHVFAMEEADFFRYYANLKNGKKNNSYAKQWQDEVNGILENISELPFSNVWIARMLSKSLPENSVFHLSGSNTARAWNFFPISNSIECYSNDGTMGIDGQISALVGESLVNPKKLHFGAVGDLTFFYDMNSLGNRHIKNNIRLLVVNNGKGAEFRIYTHFANNFGEEADKYMAAAGHYGNKSKALIKHYVEDLGFEYLTASTKEEFIEAMKRFTTPVLTERSMVFEVFTDSKDESDGIYAMNHIVSNLSGKAKDKAKELIKSIAGEKGLNKIKSILNR